VYLRGGVYRLSQAFSLGAADSRPERSHKAVFAASSGQVPVLDGAMRITGFSPYDSAKNTYRAAVPAGTHSRQLFVNGMRAQRARGALNPSAFTLSGPSPTTSDSSYASFANASSVEVVDNNAWTRLRCPLVSITVPSAGGSSLNDAVHATQTNGDTASLTFTGTGVSVISEKYSDQGQVEIFLDGSSQGPIDTSSATRQAQAVIYSTSALTAGGHTIQFVKRSGTWATLDGFEVSGVYNDTAPSISYTGGSWQYYAKRGLGDYADDVHAATANGDSVTVAFTGTGISLVTETNSDEGTIGVSLDGASQGGVNAFAPSRFAQQTVYTVGGLPIGRHSLTLTKTGGAYLVIDRFDVK